jgi:hypothetical protein
MRVSKVNRLLCFPALSSNLDFFPAGHAIAVWLACMRPNFARLGALMTFPLVSQSAVRSLHATIFHFPPTPSFDLGFSLF